MYLFQVGSDWDPGTKAGPPALRQWASAEFPGQSFLVLSCFINTVIRLLLLLKLTDHRRGDPFQASLPVRLGSSWVTQTSPPQWGELWFYRGDWTTFFDWLPEIYNSFILCDQLWSFTLNRKIINKYMSLSVLSIVKHILSSVFLFTRILLVLFLV